MSPVLDLGLGMRQCLQVAVAWYYPESAISEDGHGRDGDILEIDLGSDGAGSLQCLLSWLYASGPINVLAVFAVVDEGKVDIVVF